MLSATLPSNGSWALVVMVQEKKPSLNQRYQRPSSGRDGAGEETDFSGKTAQVIDSQVSVSPDERLSALEIHESRAERIAISEFLLYLCKGLDRRVHVVIDAAVAAAQVASVRDEDDALQRLPAARLGPQPPERKIK